MKWTYTSTPLGLARAELGANVSRAKLEAGVKRALEAVRHLTRAELEELGRVTERDGATWVRTDVGVLVIDPVEVSFWPPDWAPEEEGEEGEESGSGNLEPHSNTDSGDGSGA